MDIEEQEQKFDQSLDQLRHSMTRLTNMLVCHVTERSPQLYLKTKLHLLSCIDGLSKAVVKVQQARSELSFFQQKVGLASTKELCNPLLAKSKKEKKGGKRVTLLSAPSAKCSLFLWKNRAMIEFLSHSINRHYIRKLSYREKKEEPTMCPEAVSLLEGSRLNAGAL